MIKQLEINSTKTETQISLLFQKIREKLEEKEKELLTELENIQNSKKKELELQKEDLTFGMKAIDGSCQIIEDSISLPNQGSQILFMRKQFFARLNYLSSYHWKTQPCHNPSVNFSASKEETIFSGISNIGVVNSNIIAAEKCLISKNEKQKIFEDEKYSFRITSYSKEGKKIEVGGCSDLFSIKVKGESKNIDTKIKDFDNGKYQVTIRIKEKGTYSVSVKYNGIDLPSSPFQLVILPEIKPRIYDESPLHYKSTFGSKGVGNRQFNFPYNLSINSVGNIYVCDYFNHRVQSFDSQGNFISTFGSKGNGINRFDGPCDVAIDSKDNVYVCDFYNNRVQVFDSKGQYVSMFGSQGNGNGQFVNPSGIAIDSNDNIYVCDSKNNRIQIFESNGNFISKFGTKGNGSGQFESPCNVAISHSGNILVCELENNRVQIFDAQGQFLLMFGSKGTEDGQFHNPRGICSDLSDNILVCDHKNNRIQVFDSKGKFISKLPVNNPTGIQVDPTTQNVLVCEGSSHLITFY